MHDLRHDQEDADAATHARLKQRMDAAALRTVPMPVLRSADARTLDADARDLRTYNKRADERLATLEAVCSELSRRVAALEGRA